jgi:hypothetical protein
MVFCLVLIIGKSYLLSFGCDNMPKIFNHLIACSRVILCTTSKANSSNTKVVAHIKSLTLKTKGCQNAQPSHFAIPMYPTLLSSSIQRCTKILPPLLPFVSLWHGTKTKVTTMPKTWIYYYIHTITWPNKHIVYSKVGTNDLCQYSYVIIRM